MEAIREVPSKKETKIYQRSTRIQANNSKDIDINMGVAPTRTVPVRTPNRDIKGYGF